MISFKEFATYRHITEAISDKDLSRALQLIMSTIEKRLPSNKLPIARVPGFERYKNSDGLQFGVRYFCADNTCFRLNFKKNARQANAIDSIDIFTASSAPFPFARIQTEGISLARIIPFIANQIARPKPGKYEVDVFEESVDLTDTVDITKLKLMSEAKEFEIDGQVFSSRKDAETYLRSQGYTIRQARKILKETVIVTKGSKEVNQMNVEKSVKLIKEVIIDPNEMLDKDIPDFTRAVAKGYSHTMIIAGTPGVGKSFGVEQTLTKLFGPSSKEKPNDKWFVYKGKITLASVYEVLFKNREKVIVWDDADSVFESSDAANLLKAALDTKKYRIVSYGSKSSEYFSSQNPPYYYGGQLLYSSLSKSLLVAGKLYQKENGMKPSEYTPADEAQVQLELEGESTEHRYKFAVEQGKIPDEFEFKGSCIFISNKKMINIDSAIRDRSIAPIELDMSKQQIYDRIEMVLEHLEAGDDDTSVVPKLPMSAKQEVLEWYREVMDDYGRDDVTLRKFKTAMLYYIINPSDWKEKIIRYVGNNFK